MGRVVAWLTKRSGRMKGISEVIVVLTLILVAVVAVFAIRGWLAGQQSRMTNIDMAATTYNVAYGSSGMIIISLGVRNNLPNQLQVQAVNITLNNGTVINLPGGQATITPSLPYTINAKSDGSFTITINLGSTPPSVGVARITVQVQDTASGQSQVITAVGGG